MRRTPFLNKKADIKTKKKVQFHFVISFILLVSLLILFCLSKGRNSVEDLENVKVDISSIKTMLTNNQIIKPQTDSREYEMIRLENGLEITLISDRLTTQSGLSMTTLLGTTNELMKFPGLSTLLQKIMVTERFQSTVSRYIGKYTFEVQDDTSSFYFDIGSEGYKYAIQDFSNMLMKVDCLENNDITTVQEKLKKIENEENDKINMQLLIDYLIAPKVQNYKQEKEQVSGLQNMEEVMENLKDLFNMFLSPKNIKMAAISSLPIESMKELMQRYFGRLRNRSNSHIPFALGKLSNDEMELGQYVLTIPKKESENRELKVIIFSNDNHVQGISSLYYCLYMLEGERPDSVQFYLGYAYNYIEELKIYIKKSFKYGNQIVLEMKLTNEGKQELDYVGKVIYGILEAVKLNPHLEETYNDVKAIYEKKFAFLTIDKYSSYLNRISYNMLEIPGIQRNEEYLGNILYMDYYLEPFNQKKIMDTIQYLSLSKSVLIYKDKEGQPQAQEIHGYFDSENAKKLNSLSNLEKAFGLSYITANIKKDALASNIRAFGNEYKGKKPNNYLTSLFTIVDKKEVGDIQEIIEPKLKIYAKRDTSFQVPRIHAYFRFVFPDIRTKDEINKQMMILISNHVHRGIMMEFEEAKMSGNEIKADLNDNGFNIYISAYSDVFTRIVSQVVKMIFNENKAADDDFDYKRRRFNNLDEKSLFFLSNVVKTDVNNIHKRWQGVIDFQDLNAYTHILKKSFYMESLFYGNVDKTMIAEIRQIIKEIYSNNVENGLEKAFDGVSIEKILDTLSFNKDLPENNLQIFKLQENFNKEEEFYYLNFYQIGVRDSESDIFSSFICFSFNFLMRFEYHIDKVYKDNIIYLRTMVGRYEEKPGIIAEKFERHVTRFLERIDQLNSFEFMIIVSFVARDYKKKDLRLRQKAAKVWNEIYERTFDYTRYDTLAKEFDHITQYTSFERFKVFCKKHLGTNIKRAEFWMYPENYLEEFEKETRQLKIQSSEYNNLF